ncbi:hypothetical protein SAMN05444682_105204 [Parapedobacter indicus]|uniref:Uncharacterized protein n=1 Tax=Parapedobacter indicus TaxID=1477437 RepID=A0A1I3KHN9_9SPHI|nr:hypothetical protein SAMN05444682_105204 [Parapedobacter indicus]
MYIFLTLQEVQAQSPCFPSQPTTAAYAQGGTSLYKEQVLWLTWGAELSNVDNYQYGRHDQPLNNGSGSYASIPLGDGKYLCVEAVISNISPGGEIKSYAPGNYGGDSMDDMYHIGGTDASNQLVNGIKTSGQTVSFTITCKARLDGIPVRLAGLVLGDAESLNNSGEFFHVTADGTWNIVELKKNLANTAPYMVEKTTEAGTTRQRIHFQKGNNDNTAAVSFLTFNSSAYGAFNDDYEVSFDVTLRGTGTTALALGLLTINADRGDAPESYGAPLHLFDGTALSDDEITMGVPENLNRPDYTPGALVSEPSTYLGSTGPDPDAVPLYSEDALGDDNDPDGPTNEEDAWPAAHKRWSYNATYKKGNTIAVEIPYQGSANARIVAWIDFNWNGEFEESERSSTEAPAGTGTVILRWTIPENRIAKSTYARIRYAVNEDEILSPTTVASSGEVEDHFIYILGPATTNPMLPSKVKQPTQSP